jgi:hypothetical protein
MKHVARVLARVQSDRRKISASGERRWAADAICALRTCEGNGNGPLCNERIDGVQCHRLEIGNVDNRRDRSHCKRTRRVEMPGPVMTAPMMTVMTAGCIVQRADDRCLVGTERQLQPVGVRREHESDRQKCAHHQYWQQPSHPFPDQPAVHEGLEYMPIPRARYRQLTVSKNECPKSKAQETVAGRCTVSTCGSLRNSPSHLETTAVAILFPITLVAERPMSRK